MIKEKHNEDFLHCEKNIFLRSENLFLNQIIVWSPIASLPARKGPI